MPSALGALKAAGSLAQQSVGSLEQLAPNNKSRCSFSNTANPLAETERESNANANNPTDGSVSVNY